MILFICANDDFSDEGCVRNRRTDAGQKAEDCVNSDSPVIGAFKGENLMEVKLFERMLMVII